MMRAAEHIIINSGGRWADRTGTYGMAICSGSRSRAAHDNHCELRSSETQSHGIWSHPATRFPSNEAIQLGAKTGVAGNFPWTCSFWRNGTWTLLSPDADGTATVRVSGGLAAIVRELATRPT